jgi:hypothetical protein
LETTEKIWRGHLVEMLNVPTTPDLTEAETAEANKHLQYTLAFCTRGGQAEKVVLTEGTLALLHAAVGQYAQAEEMLTAAFTRGLGELGGFADHMTVVKKLAAEQAAVEGQ